MAMYKAGQRYFKNTVTGAVFQYRERLIGIANLDEYEANEDGELVKVGGRPKAVEKLNPTDTPEKAAPEPVVTKPTVNKTPTMTSVEPK